MNSRKKLITLLLVTPTFLLGCMTAGGKSEAAEVVEDDLEDVEVVETLKAVILEVNLEDEELIVDGIGKNDTIGEGAFVRAIPDSKIQDQGVDATFEDIAVGDEIEMIVEQVTLSLPAQANVSYINILEQSK